MKNKHMKNVQIQENTSLNHNDILFNAQQNNYNKKDNKCWQDVDKLEPPLTAGEKVKWYSCFGKEFGSFIKKSNVNSLYDHKFYPLIST